jgi:hypothetical protein
MKSFLVVLNQGWKVRIHVFTLEIKTSCIYQTEERLEQREIQEWVKASILVVGDVSPTQNLQELGWYLEYGRIILTRNSVGTWTENTQITTQWPLGRCWGKPSGHRWWQECEVQPKTH